MEQDWNEWANVEGLIDGRPLKRRRAAGRQKRSRAKSVVGPRRAFTVPPSSPPPIEASTHEEAAWEGGDEWEESTPREFNPRVFEPPPRYTERQVVDWWSDPELDEPRELHPLIRARNWPGRVRRVAAKKADSKVTKTTEAGESPAGMLEGRGAASTGKGRTRQRRKTKMALRKWR